MYMLYFVSGFVAQVIILPILVLMMFLFMALLFSELQANHTLYILSFSIMNLISLLRNWVEVSYLVRLRKDGDYTRFEIKRRQKRRCLKENEMIKAENECGQVSLRLADPSTTLPPPPSSTHRRWLCDGRYYASASIKPTCQIRQ
jgi:ABC-type microcin C transport system permease subunit YejE